MEYVKIHKIEARIYGIEHHGDNLICENKMFEDQTYIWYALESFPNPAEAAVGAIVDLKTLDIVAMASDPNEIRRVYWNKVYILEQRAKRLIREIMIDDVFFPHRPEQIEAVRSISRMVQRAKNRVYDLGVDWLDSGQVMSINDAIRGIQNELATLTIGNAPSFYLGENLIGAGQLTLDQTTTWPLEVSAVNPIAGTGICAIVGLRWGTEQIPDFKVSRVSNKQTKLTIPEFEGTLKITARNLCGPAWLYVENLPPVV